MIRLLLLVALLGSAHSPRHLPREGERAERTCGRLRSCARARPVLTLLAGGPQPSQLCAGTLAGVTTTRASSKTCSPSSSSTTQLGNDAPAVEPKGLLIEADHTNFLLYSAQLDNAAWILFGSVAGVPGSTPTLDVDNIAGPGGAVTAERFNLQAPVTATSGDQQLILQDVSSLPAGTYTATAWLKAGTISQVGVFIQRLGDPLGAPTTCNLGSAWMRCAKTLTIGTTSTLRVLLGWRGDHGTSSQGNFYVTDTQLEASKYARSNVETTGTSATGNKDVDVLPYAALPVSSGRLQVDLSPLWGASEIDTTRAVVDTRDSSGFNGLVVYVTSDAKLNYGPRGAATSATLSTVPLAWTAGATYRLALWWMGQNGYLFRDGVLLAAETGGGLVAPSAHSTLVLGHSQLEAQHVDGHLSNFQVSR